ncbi:hypothetical protein CYMTET_36793, partial [Cymbomonas tetramitiformis]
CATGRGEPEMLRGMQAEDTELDVCLVNRTELEMLSHMLVARGAELDALLGPRPGALAELETLSRVRVRVHARSRRGRAGCPSVSLTQGAGRIELGTPHHDPRAECHECSAARKSRPACDRAHKQSRER